MGNLTSQFFANVYLSPLDHFVQERLKIGAYLRYVDDFVLFHDSKAHLHEAKAQIVQFLAEELRLLIHPRKSEVSPAADGLTFLGQRIFRTHRRLRRENVQRFRKRLAIRLQQYKTGSVSPDLLECQLNSWLGHAQQADTWRLRKKLYNHLRHIGLNVLETDRFSWRLLEV